MSNTLKSIEKKCKRIDKLLNPKPDIKPSRILKIKPNDNFVIGSKFKVKRSI